MPRSYEESMAIWKNHPGCLNFLTVLFIIAIIIGILYGCVSCIF